MSGPPAVFGVIRVCLNAALQLKVRSSIDEHLETLVKGENKTVLENIRSKQTEEFQASEG